MSDQFDLDALLGQAMEMQPLMDGPRPRPPRPRSPVEAGRRRRVTVDRVGRRAVPSVTIRPGAVDPDDVEMLEDLVLAALNEASPAAGPGAPARSEPWRPR